MVKKDKMPTFESAELPASLQCKCNAQKYERTRQKWVLKKACKMSYGFKSFLKQAVLLREKRHHLKCTIKEHQKLLFPLISNIKLSQDENVSVIRVCHLPEDYSIQFSPILAFHIGRISDEYLPASWNKFFLYTW